MNVLEITSLVLDLKREDEAPLWALRTSQIAASWLAEVYESRVGSLEYSAAAMTAVVGYAYLEHQAGRLSYQKLNGIRRLAMDMEDVLDYGAVGNASLPHWGHERNPLLRPVSDEVRQDGENVIGLALMALEKMDAAGYYPSLVRAYRMDAFPKFVRHCMSNGSVEYSDEVVDEYLDSVELLKGQLDRRALSLLRCGALHVRSIHESGALYAFEEGRPRSRTLSGPFGYLLEGFELWCAEGNLEQSTAVRARYSIAKFLTALADAGLTDFRLVERRDVQNARRAISKGCSEKYVATMLSHLRAFARFVQEEHLDHPSFELWLGRSPKQRKKLPISGYSASQADGIVQSVDVGALCGKRDRAMLAVAKNLGLRPGDIVGMRMTDIDWRSNTLTIIQDKTDCALTLPIDVETGEAIASYILEERGEGVDPDLLFLSRYDRGKPLSVSRLRDIIEKHAVPVCGPDYRGPHGGYSFRRGLGAALVEAEVPLSDVGDILGHGDVKSTAPYAAVAVERLRICACSLVDAPADSIWWLK